MKRKSKLKRNEGIAGLLFVTPSMIYFFVFFLIPLVICIYASFTNWNILSVKRIFVGSRNFEKMFADPKFWTALKNTVYMLINTRTMSSRITCDCALPIAATKGFSEKRCSGSSTICPLFLLW